MGLPTRLHLEIVSPEGLLLKEDVDEVIVPGERGYFGVRPGHTPFLSTLGVGEITYRAGTTKGHLACFWGFCEVLPDRVAILAETAERAEDIDRERAEAALQQAQERMKAIRDEEGFSAAHETYVRAVTRLAVVKRRSG